MIDNVVDFQNESTSEIKQEARAAAAAATTATQPKPEHVPIKKFFLHEYTADDVAAYLKARGACLIMWPKNSKPMACGVSFGQATGSWRRLLCAILTAGRRG